VVQVVNGLFSSALFGVEIEIAVVVGNTGICQ
jgi:hypothetical protein